MSAMQGFLIKSLAQNLICALPRPLGDSLYYMAQRRFGGLRYADPISQIRRAAELVAMAASVRPWVGARVIEIGTGRNLTLPIVMWLCGAERVRTVDIHRYLRAELVERDMEQMFHAEDEVVPILESVATREELHARWERLRACASDSAAIMKLCGITYSAPFDARGSLAPASSYDFHISNNVLEHVPPGDLRAILREGFRALAVPGALMHRVDLSDHFAQRDPRLSPVNFLRYSERAWAVLSGNRLMYQNRLRIDDWETLLREDLTDGDIRLVSDGPDPLALAALRHGLPLARRFSTKPPEINATLSIFVIARK